LHVPSDGSANPKAIAQELISRAKHLGVKFFEHCRVEAILRTSDQQAVAGVMTSQGKIATSTLVVAAGVWSPGISRPAGIPLALVPMKHQYVRTATIPELHGRIYPNVRDPDHLIYWRQAGGSGNTGITEIGSDHVIYGGYERTPQAVPLETLKTSGTKPTEMAFDELNFRTIRSGTISRWPLISEKSNNNELRVCGVESFTADGEFLLGPSKRLHGFWAACGFCAHGISAAGGVGKILAQWIHNGTPSLNLEQMDIDRFGDQGFDETFVRNGAIRVYSTYYDVVVPSSAGAKL